MADNNVNENEEIITIPDMVAKYITPEAFQDLLDNNTVDQNCVYIVHYDVNTLPAGLSSDPILEVFIGSNRVSAIINLNNLPPIFDTKYINSDILSDRVADDISLSTTKEELINRINATIEELGDADFTSTTYPTLPSNLGLSNKLYLYFDAESSKYVMYIMHPQLKKLIPLKLIPDKGSTPTPTPPPTPTPTENVLKLQYSTIVSLSQSAQIHASNQTYYIDMGTMSRINFSAPTSNFIVQGKMAFWSFNDIEQYIANNDPALPYVTYNNCYINLTYNNVVYNAYFHSDFELLEYITYTDEHQTEREDFFIKTSNKYLDVSTEQVISTLSKNCWVKPNRTSWGTYLNELEGYGTYGFTIIANSIVSPEVDPTHFPYGYVNGRIYNTITGKRGCTNIDDYIDLITGDTSVVYDSYIDAKIPFASLAEYYLSKSITTKSDVVIENV